MKIKRSDLNKIIEDYLNEAVLSNPEGEMSYTVPRCNFEPNTEFLDFFTVVFKGDSTKTLPTWISPAFKEMFFSEFMPYTNAFIMPMFGIEAKCDFLREMQEAFIKYKNLHLQGRESSYNFERKENTNKKRDEALEQDYGNFFSWSNRKIERSGISLPETSRSRVLMSPPGDFTSGEVHLASHLVGNLDNARSNSTEIREAHKNMGRLIAAGGNLTPMNVSLALKSLGNIEGVENTTIETIVNALSNHYPSAGATYVGHHINTLFDKLDDSNIF